MDYQGFGDGSDGVATLSGTDAPIDSSCSGASGGTSLSATNASFTDGDIIFIHQSRGTGAGSWELNFIDTYVAGTITTQFPLVNTYTDSGASQAQVIQPKQYSDVTVSGTLTAKAWNGDVGGIIAFFSSGNIVVSGTITAAGKGYRGGSGVSGASAYQGEGTSGAGAVATSANGTGGGGGGGGVFFGGGGGGGGGHLVSGSSSNIGGLSGTGGTGGGGGGDATLSTMIFGGAGGGGGSYDSGGGSPIVGPSGGHSGGIIFIWGQNMTVTGSITASGLTGGNASGDDTGGGGGGAGGSIYIRCAAGVFGTNLVTAAGGAGGASTGSGSGVVGVGSPGRIRIEACQSTGSTNPSASESIGDHDFCQSFIHIY